MQITVQHKAQLFVSYLVTAADLIHPITPTANEQETTKTKQRKRRGLGHNG